ncbi:POTRA domain-containing protein [Edaphobacter flagellatus]|uniref:POTRA domain-containing protein n=1 Tax=Edaphobacter flagellatus TaxID=1933044 RepID=UPI0021B197EA|nr:POTRA domain-containing protein [Edaphobacter flagellatus]
MRPTTGFLALLALCLLPVSNSLNAQTVILPKSISFTGAPAYSQAELLAFTHLTPGANSTVTELNAAAQKLNDTGLFSDIRFASQSTGLVFSLKMMPNDNLLPARFANFVWWTPEELSAALKTRVPLYQGTVPTAGNMQDSVVAALKAMLAEKSVTATVVAIPVSPGAGATPTSVKFLIDSPEVRVHTLHFASTSPALQPKLDKVAQKVSGEPFDQLTTESTITSLITDVYRNDGYLNASVTNYTHSAPQVTSDAINLDLTAAVSEGEPYHLSRLTWPGSDVMSTADFDKQAKLKPEDVASQLALKQSLTTLARAYYAKGYQDVKVQAPASLDKATHHVSYTVHVVPGEQYRLHSVKAEGLSDVQRKEFDSAWRMNPGDFYDVNYLTTFLNKNTALRSLNGYSATYKAFSDPNTHLVDLVITFVKGGTLVQVN